MAFERSSTPARVAVVALAIAAAGCGEAPGDLLLRDIARELKRTNEVLLRIDAKLGAHDAGGAMPTASPQSLPPPTPAAPTGEIDPVLQPIREELRALAEKLDRAGIVPSEQPQPKQETEVARTYGHFQGDAKSEELRHFLWTRRQVLAAYGKPDYTLPGSEGCLTWTYVVGEGNLVFEFVDGEVSRSYTQ